MVINHVLQHHHGKGLKVFKINSCTLYTDSFMGLPNAKSKERETERDYFLIYIKKNPDGSIELKITENSLCTAACFCTDF